MKFNIIIFICVIVRKIKCNSALPTVILHGIHDDCHGWMKEVAENVTKKTGTYSECINIGIEDKWISIFESMKH